MSFPFLQKPISPLKMALGEFVLPSVLPHDIEALKTLLVAQQNAHAAVVQAMHQEAVAIRQEAHDYVIRMLEQAVLARQRMFGASSEQLSAQSRLFDEAEALAQTSTEAQDVAPIAAEVSAPAPDVHKPDVKPGRGKRAPLAAGLPRVDEGWAQMPIDYPITTYHAWCLDRQGNVVDPTWEHRKGSEYLGIPIKTSALQVQILATQHWGFFIHNTFLPKGFSTNPEAFIESNFSD